MDSENTLTGIPTARLVDELAKRIGVQATWIDPYQPYSFSGDGPVVVLIVED